MTEETRLAYSANHVYREGYEQGKADTIDECIALARTEIDFESQAEQKRFVDFLKHLKEQK